MGFHPTTIDISETISARVVHYGDWEGEVELDFFENGKAATKGFILTGEYLLKQGKEHSVHAVTDWFMHFIANFAHTHELPIQVEAEVTHTIHTELQMQEETIVSGSIETVITHDERWMSNAVIVCYDLSHDRKEFLRVEVPGPWILAVARFAYWDRFGDEFMSAAEDARQEIPTT